MHGSLRWRALFGDYQEQRQVEALRGAWQSQVEGIIWGLSRATSSGSIKRCMANLSWRHYLESACYPQVEALFGDKNNHSCTIRKYKDFLLLHSCFTNLINLKQK